MRLLLLILFVLAGTPALPAPIHVAEKGDLAGVKELPQTPGALQAPDKDGLTPLMLTAAGGHKDIVALLLLNGARITFCRWETRCLSQPGQAAAARLQQDWRARAPGAA